MGRIHFVVVAYPLLPLSCLLFSILSLALHDSVDRILTIVCFSINVLTAVLTTCVTVHYLRFRPTAESHCFLILPLLLSWVAFGLCAIPFHRVMQNLEPMNVWFTWIVTFPICIIASAFSLTASVIVSNDMRKHQRSTHYNDVET